MCLYYSLFLGARCISVLGSRHVRAGCVVRAICREHSLHLRMGRATGLGVGPLEPQWPEKKKAVFQKGGEYFFVLYAYEYPVHTLYRWPLQRNSYRVM